MERRKFLSGAGICSLTALSGCSDLLPNRPGDKTINDNDQPATVTPTPTTEPTADTWTEPDIVIAEFSGQSATVTDSFEPGIQLRFNIQYQGYPYSTFKASLIDPSGEYDDQLLINVPHGAFRTTIVASNLPEAEAWALKIETDNVEDSETERPGWEVIVWEPRLYTS